VSTLVTISEGGYQSLVSGGAIADGVVALPGFEIRQATFADFVPLEQAFQNIAVYLEQQGRPIKALCALQLRSPKPFSPEGFQTFNVGYLQLLDTHQLRIEGNSPLARTNVVPVSPPAVPSVYTFSYTMPSQEKRKTFVAAGVGDIRDDGSLIRSGETSEEAGLEKVKFMTEATRAVLERLEVRWQDITHLNFYGLQPVPSSVLPLFEGALRHGLTWYPSVPPIIGVDTEIDVRGVFRETFDH
jgi:hypothetical protein